MRSIMRVLFTVYDYLVIYLGLALLAIQCLAWSVFALILHPLLSGQRGRALGRRFNMFAFRGFLASLAWSGRLSFDLKDLDALRDAPPLILAPNHPSLLDALMIFSRLPNVSCILKASLMNNVFLGAGARLARYIRNEPVRHMVQSAVRDFDCGSHLLLFPEGTRTTRCPVNPLSSSVGAIAHQAQVPVQTILIETDSKYLSKGWSLFRVAPMPIHYRVRLGRRFDPPQNTHRFMAELEHYFSHVLVQGSAFYPVNSLPAQPEHDLDPPALPLS
jgi:1-acyl-sn-glycerol-3-phosphate acyltransferase